MADTVKMTAPNGEEADIPTDQVDHYKQLGAKLKEPEGDSLLMAGIKSIPGVVGNLAAGVGKGAADTAVGLGELVHKVPGVSSAVDAMYGTPGVSSNAFKAAHEELKPDGTAQSIGKGAEQFGEFFIPGMAETPANLAKAGKVAGLGRMMLEGAKTAGVTGAQTGGDPRQMATSGLTGAVGGAIGNAVEATPKAIRNGIAVKVADPRTAGMAKAAGETINDPMWMAARNMNRAKVAQLIKDYGLTGGEDDLATIGKAPLRSQEVMSAASNAMDPAKRSFGHLWSLLAGAGAVGSLAIPSLSVGGHAAVALPLAGISLASKYPGYVAKGVDAAMPAVRGGLSGLAGSAQQMADPLIQELLARREQ